MSYDVVVRASDNEGNSDSQTLHVTVTNEAGTTIIGKRGNGQGRRNQHA